MIEGIFTFGTFLFLSKNGPSKKGNPGSDSLENDCMFDNWLNYMIFGRDFTPKIDLDKL